MKYLLFFILILFTSLSIGTVSAEKEIVIGAIIDENGNSASFAKGIEASVELAAADMNEFYSKAGKDLHVVIKKAGTDGSKESAAKAAEDLVAQGVQIIVRPTTSEELAGCLPILTREGIISINPTTSFTLSLPGDPVVRLCTDDFHLLGALENFNLNNKDVIPAKTVILSRGDFYGINLSEKVKSITDVSDIILYPPKTKDFTSILEKLNSTVSFLTDEYGESNVCIFAISIDEITDILAQASNYPNLKRIGWSGMDGISLNPTIFENETAAEFAVATNLRTLSFNTGQSAVSDYWRVYDNIKAVTTGHQPSIYEILPYDETVMASRMMEYNLPTIEEKLSIADYLGKTTYGATGWLKLNQNNDREFGGYYFYMVQKNADGAYVWMPYFAYLYGMETTIPLSGVKNTYIQHFMNP